ncbi:hypothetical protein F5Y03DRAFT_379249 [Xylaria venustula]|nr:hypothetical protein F5Y03DRAFT_379249 [Xylaria venustula]
MIGDNPESDIQGANNYESPSKTRWQSILVETGVYTRGHEPAYPPTYIAHTCQDAVQLAFEKEGYVAGS